MKTLKIDEKWSVACEPENNGRPLRVIRYGEHAGRAADWGNLKFALFYEPLEARVRIAELELERDMLNMCASCEL